MPQDITAQGVRQHERKDQQLSSNSGHQHTSYVISWKCLIKSKGQVWLCHVKLHVCLVCLVVCCSIPPPSLHLDATYACLSYAGHHSSGGKATGEKGPAIELECWTSAYKLCTSWKCLTHVCTYVRSYITCLIQQLKLLLVDSCKNVVYDGKHHLKRARRDG